MLRDDSHKEVPKTVPLPQEAIAPFEQNPEPAETSAFVEEQQNFSSSDIDKSAEPSQGLSPPPEWVGFAEKIQKKIEHPGRVDSERSSHIVEGWSAQTRIQIRSTLRSGWR